MISSSPDVVTESPHEGPGLREPRELLDPRARTIWFFNELIGAAVFGGITLAISTVARLIFDFHWGWVAASTGLIVVLMVVWSVVAPRLRYRTWRFEIREDEVDLLHGIVVRTRQIVPMSRIQHVDTTRGPLQRRYGLASVVFYTAAGSMTIPALSVERAAEVRDRIAALAKVHDDL
jgi:membrane protein YdbS with pleckstrin-like domain